MYDLLKIHDILDNTMSEKVDKTAHILAYLFNSVSWQNNEALASQFCPLHNFKDTCPSSEVYFMAALPGHVQA